MKELFISKYPVYGNSTFNGRIGCILLNRDKLWVTGLQPADQFIIDSYEFDKYIFFVDYCDLETIGSWNIEGKQVDIIIRKCIDVAAALYMIGADYNLNIRAFFMDNVEKYFRQYKYSISSE